MLFCGERLVDVDVWYLLPLYDNQIHNACITKRFAYFSGSK